MRILAAILTALALLAAPGPSAASAQDAGCPGVLPGLGVRLLEVPTHLADDPRAQSSIIDELDPGATIQRQVRFSNGEPDRPLDVELSAEPADISDGEFLVGADGADDDLASWVDLEPATASIPPCSHVDTTVTVAVPGDAAGGERYAAVVAEHLGTDASGVTMSSRIGVRLYLQVSGEGPADFDMVIDSLTPRRGDTGRPIIDVGVTNTGDRALDISGTVGLIEGPGGLSVEPYPTSDVSTLAPGASGTATVEFDEQVPAGPWLARARMRSGEIEREAEARITFPASGSGQTVAAHPLQDRSVVLPVAWLLLLLTVLALWVAWRRRRRDDEETDADDGGVDSAAEDGAQPAGSVPAASR